MSIAPHNVGFIAAAENFFTAAWSRLTGAFTDSGSNFSPEEVLRNATNIDPYFIPRAPMSNTNIDIGAQLVLSQMGIKRSKEVTAQSHPELYAVWKELSRRAGLARTPQLIIGESRMMNAMTLSSNEEIGMTTALLQRLSLREVAAVLGHELGHATSKHIMPRELATSALAFAGAFAGNAFADRGGVGSLVDHGKLKPNFFERALRKLFPNKHGRASSILFAELYIAFGALIGITLGKHLSVNPTEHDADRKGAMISGDPRALMSGLEKLENSGKRKPVSRFLGWLQSGYPTTEHRISELRKIADSMPQNTVPVVDQVITHLSTQATVTAADAEPGIPDKPVEKPSPAPPSPRSQVRAVVSEGQSERLGTEMTLP